MNIRVVEISALKTDRSPRLDGESEDHVYTLSAMQDEWPPILVHAETMQVIDGMHRLRAAQFNGRSTIKAEFFEGTEEEAFILAVKSNISHGLPLTLADRTAAATQLLKAHPAKSDRWIAVTTGISAATVASIRKSGGIDSASTDARVGRDGKIRPLNSAGGRAAARQAILTNPQASLRDIAKISGVSPGTVRDVRKRMINDESQILGSAGSSQADDAQGSSEALVPDKNQPADDERSKVSRSRFMTGNTTSLISKLRKDPSIRHTQTGRDLLRSLDAYAQASERCVELVNDLPPHTIYLMEEFACRCADEWAAIGKQLKKHLDSAG